MEKVQLNWALTAGSWHTDSTLKSQLVPTETIHILAGTENKHRNSSEKMTPGIINSWWRRQFQNFHQHYLALFQRHRVSDFFFSFFFLLIQQWQGRNSYIAWTVTKASSGYCKEGFADSNFSVKYSHSNKQKDLLWDLATDCNVHNEIFASTSKMPQWLGD